MRIIQINAVYGILSTGITTMQLSQALTREGINNIAVYGLYKGNYDNTLYIGSKYRRKIDLLLTRIFRLPGYFSCISTIRLLRFIDSYKPDIVHLRNLHEYYINIPLLLKYLSRNQIATVITLHDCFFFTGVCPYFTINNCLKWKSICSDCDYYNYYVRKMFLDKCKLLKMIKRLAVVGVSDWVTNMAQQSRILSEALVITRIYNWIDLDVFKESDKSTNISLRNSLGIADKFVILCVASSWSNRKGLNAICDVANQLNDEFRIVIVGKIHVEISLPNIMIHIPMIFNNSELVKFYSMADVFLNLSLEETFGKVTAEALSCGTPVIVVKSTANPELVSEDCGFVINQIEDINSIISCIKIIKQKGKNTYSSSCRNKATLLFNMKNNINEYISLYQNLLSIKL